MKTIKMRWLLILTAVVFPWVAFGQQYEDPDFYYEGIAYKILDDGESVGAHVNDVWANIQYHNYTLETINIPSQVYSSEYGRSFTVKKINNGAFCLGYHYVKNITIPESVEIIGYEAFAQSGVEEVYNSDHGGWWYCVSAEDNLFFYNARNCTSIAKNAFLYGTRQELDDSDNEHIKYCYFRIGNDVEELPSNLPYIEMLGKTLFIPDSVKSIQKYALNGRCGTIVFGKGLETLSEQNIFSSPVIYITSVIPPQCESSIYTKTLYVPVGTRRDYRSHPEWGRIENIIEKEYIAVQSLDLGYSDISIYKGEILRFNPIPIPSNATAFEPDGNGIAKMTAINTSSPDHIIHLADSTFVGAEEGEYEITAYVDTVIAKCHVTVLPEYQGNAQDVRIQLGGIDLDSKIIKTGETLNLEALIYPVNSLDASDYQEIVWSSSDNAIAGVTGNGVVTGIAEGECDVVVTITNTNTGNSLSDMCHIVVDNTSDINDVGIGTLITHVDVYNLQGQLLRRQVPRDVATQGLNPGLYIVDHRKVLIVR